MPGEIYEKKPPVVTPSNVNSLVSQLLKSDSRLLNLAVRGEITKITYSSAGHIYFTLTDGTSKLSVNVWKYVADRLKVKPEDKKKVVCKGSISVYEPNGTYSLICSDIEVEGAGEQAEKLRELAEKLKKEGVFDKKRQLPEYPKKIAVVTSPTGAVVHDIEKTLAQRFPCVKMVVIPAVVQGENAPLSIVRGIEYAQTTGADILIFGRGGGAAEDLSAFNAEIVARAVYNSAIPTISAVGHEIDVTISDLAADARAATPTAAAMIATPDKDELKQRLKTINQSLLDKLGAKAEQKRAQTNAIAERLTELLERCYKTKSADFERAKADIQRLMDRKFEIAESELEKQRGLISALNPLSTLKRGYSIVKLGEKTVSESKELSKGDTVEILLNSGSASAVIEEVRE